MNPLRILAAATAMEVCAAAAVTALAGLGGARNGWLDVINNFAPIILLVAVIGAGLGFITLEGPARMVTMGLGLIAVIYGLALVAPEVAKSWGPPAGRGAQFRVLSANVWHDNPTPDLAVASLVARDADAVMLQESDGTIQAGLAPLKARYPFSSDCPGMGVQIFSKTPIVAQGCGPVASPRLDLAWIQVRMPQGETVTLVTTHFAWPFPPGPQAAERAILARQVHELPTDDMILGGDFNTTPWSFAMKHQDRVLAPLQRQTRAWFSWPARLNALRQPWPVPILPIDHFYAGSGWTRVRLTNLRIPGSDHFATEAVFARR